MGTRKTDTTRKILLTTPRPPSLRAALAAVLGSALIALPATAAQQVDRDRSDNTFYFTYDATTGTMPEQSSSAGPISVNDPVDFFIYIREREGAALGQRLAARLVLKLVDYPGRDEDAVIYDGDFSFEIDVAEQTEVYSDSSSERIVLRPRQGKRRHVVRFVFELPSGEYRAIARFAKS